MLTPLARTIATLPDIKDWEHLTLDATGARLAHDLSLTDWRDWLDQAVPPFQRCTLTINPMHYLLAGEDQEGTATALVFLISEAGITVEMHWWKDMLPGPLAVDWTQTQPNPLFGEEATYGWGPAYALRYDAPAMPVVIRSYGKMYKTMPPDVFMSMLVETAGQVRMVLASLALINRQRPVLNAEPTLREGRALYKGRSVPNYKPRLVVLRPDAERAPTVTAGEPTGIHKRDHSVRRHLRRYKSGKTVWVREHRRGDEALGTVQKTYLIEADPNKGLHNGPPD